MTQEKLIKKIHKFIKDNQLTPYLDTVALANDLASLFNKQMVEREKEIIKKIHNDLILEMGMQSNLESMVEVVHEYLDSLTKSEETR